MRKLLTILIAAMFAGTTLTAVAQAPAKTTWELSSVVSAPPGLKT